MADIEKLAQDIAGLTLLEASKLKTMLEDMLGVTAAAPMMGMGMMAAAAPVAAAAAEPVEEPTEFDVIIKDGGPKKIQVIKVVRTLTTLGLKEAKDAVEATPHTLLSAVTKDAAADAKKKLEEEGAVVEIKAVV
ncbi:MAG: 50S ribosomal protein L7/L12 [Phototrophicaceae bacterium]|jgi:large subunit ribosomal protein L7/L12